MKNGREVILAAACLILGAVLLIPAGMQIWKFLFSRFWIRRLRYLPEAHTDFIFVINGLTVDSFTVALILSVAGAVLLLAGVRMLIRTARQ